MEIKCITKLSQEGQDAKLTTIYDIIELQFELSEKIDAEVFFCVDLSEEYIYLYRDNLKIKGNKFSIHLEENLLDIIKSLPNSILNSESQIKMSFQIELNVNSNFTVAHNEIQLENLWFK